MEGGDVTDSLAGDEYQGDKGNEIRLEDGEFLTNKLITEYMLTDDEKRRRYNDSQQRKESYLGTGKVSNYQPLHSSYDNDTNRTPPKTMKDKDDAQKYSQIKQIVKDQQYYHKEVANQKPYEAEEKEDTEFQRDRDESATDDITRNNSMRDDESEKMQTGPYETQKVSRMDESPRQTKHRQMKGKVLNLERVNQEDKQKGDDMSITPRSGNITPTKSVKWKYSAKGTPA